MRRWNGARDYLAAHGKSGVAISTLLVSVAALVAIFRWEILAQIPYPPSADAGSDLYVTRLTLGHPLVHSWISQQPPVYYLLIEAPATAALAPFVSVDFVMAMVPALIVFPGYLLIRETGASRPGAILGAALLAVATDFSLMVTWNGGSNMFAIVLLAFLLYFLIRTFRTPDRWHIALSGLFLSLIAGTHELTFTLALLILLYATVAWVLLSRSVRVPLKTFFSIIAVGAVLSLPYLAVYVTSVHQSTNLGVGGYLYALTVAYQMFPTFAWGFQGTVVPLLAWVDASLGIVALSALWLHSERLDAANVLACTMIGALTLPLLDASNAFRGFYFLPLAFIVPIPVLLEDGCGLVSRALVARIRRPTTGSPPTPGDGRPRRWSLRTRSALPRLVPLGVAGALLLMLIVPNVEFSQTSMQQAEAFYSGLNPDSVNVLNWMKGNTAPSATFFDMSGISAWIWGYADRWAYAPGSLNGQVTVQSYQSTLTADYVMLGQHLLGNQYLYVATNYPSPHAAPQVYLDIVGYWDPLEESESGLVLLHALQGSSPVNLSLDSAQYEGLTNSSSGSTMSYTYQFLWPSAGIGAHERIALNGQDVSIAWSLTNATLQNVSMAFNVPPSGYYYEYVDIPQGALAGAMKDTFRAGPDTFSLQFDGGQNSQLIDSSGWLRLQTTVPSTLWVNGSGIVAAGAPTVSIAETSHILGGLGVDYIVLEYDRAYDLYLRINANALSGVTTTRVYQSGNYYVFSAAMVP
ncbi:MAG: hypothetical protein L3K09_06770 [Thermoplasmata archaeon]|nr:hypothetical protein [Thermoplasmata archaeon]